MVTKYETTERGKARLGRNLVLATCLVPPLVTAISVVYREDLWGYAYCIGREETFTGYLDEEDVDPSWWAGSHFVSLPVYHPVRLFYFLSLVVYFLMTPIVYVAIYRFRRNWDRTVTGKHIGHCHWV